MTWKFGELFCNRSVEIAIVVHKVINVLWIDCLCTEIINDAEESKNLV